MNVWDVLGIEPTEDDSVISSAYAKKLTLEHPENDPQWKEMLHEAYEVALKLARKRSAATEASSMRLNDHGERLENTYENVENAREEVAVSTAYPYAANPIQVFLGQVSELYSNFANRIQPSFWQALFQENAEWDIENHQLQDEMVMFLEEKHYFPMAVWAVLEKTFRFLEHEEELRGRHAEEFIDYIVEQVNGTVELSYDCFMDVKIDFDIDRYLYLREMAQYMLMEGELEEVGAYLSEAHELFQDDPDLVLMRGKYFEAIGEMEQAMDRYNQVIAMKPDEFEGRWHRAQLLYKLEQYEAALADCNRLLEIEGNQQDALMLSIHCYTQLGQLKEARMKLQQSNDIDNVHDILRYVHGIKLFNKYRYAQEVEEKGQRQARKQISLFLLYYYLHLTWLYLLVYVGLQLFISVPLVVTILWLAVMVWNGWKTFKTYRMMTT
ncbi:TPR domain protein [Paenibacillus alvei TS-15]|uniref:TPR domain protein n=1 Tax=Paenibacillus alvei TS-15 TaxID=1117108 RepID=S9UF44_PAEAL|nr:J domain-containing protein [Paenibacillus alvei]EPY09080.1 TPR domain protein [Paenibacillus alvei TS-15]